MSQSQTVLPWAEGDQSLDTDPLTKGKATGVKDLE